MFTIIGCAVLLCRFASGCVFMFGCFCFAGLGCFMLLYRVVCGVLRHFYIVRFVCLLGRRCVYCLVAVWLVVWLPTVFSFVGCFG